MCFTLLLQMRRRLIAWQWRTGRLGSYGEGSVQMRRRNITLWPKKRVLLVLATVEIGRLYPKSWAIWMQMPASFMSRWRSRVGALLATEPQSVPLYSEHTFMRTLITCSANGLRSVEFKCSMFSAMDQTIMLEEHSVEFNIYSHMPTYQWTSSTPTKVLYIPYKSALYN